jgi:adenylate kinase family enzyme
VELVANKQVATRYLVVGGTGAGKTTVAREIAERVGKGKGKRKGKQGQRQNQQKKQIPGGMTARKAKAEAI